MKKNNKPKLLKNFLILNAVSFVTISSATAIALVNGKSQEYSFNFRNELINTNQIVDIKDVITQTNLGEFPIKSYYEIDKKL
ncbi:hypothetical protein [Spiroplasma endosymbiont of Atherix ibis]|uniref:hypothetical protein n=1 Tax=Spiroplasma endosymbiont of Atherix ibis TaxID=3066291 RepID=UPI0030D0B13D